MKRPIRDRAIYRAAANPKNPNYEWGKNLIAGLGTTHGLLRWIYRNFDIANLVYSHNPFFECLEKSESFNGKYIPIPITLGKS